MQIITNVSSDSPNNQHAIVERLFIFLVVGELVSANEREVDIYTVISFSQEEHNSHCNIKLTHEINNDKVKSNKNNKSKDPAINDRYHFFNELRIIKQFWGKDTKKIKPDENYSSTVELLSDNIPEFKDKEQGEIISYLNSLIENEYSDYILFVSDEKSLRRESFLLIPRKIDTTDNELKIFKGLDTKHNSNIFRNICSTGYWFKHSTTAVVSSAMDGFAFSHKIITNNIKSPDFKVYYQLPKHSELKRQSVDFAEKGITDKPKGEIIRVYSDVEYFDEWVEHGIHESPVLRFKNSDRFDELANSGKLDLYEAKIEAEDKRLSRRRELQYFLVSVFASVLLAIGFDETRLSSGLRDILEIKDLLKAEIVWTIISIALIPKVVYLLRSHGIRQFFWVLCSIPYLLLFIFLFAITDGYTILRYSFFESYTTAKLLYTIDLFFTFIILIYENFKRIINYILRKYHKIIRKR